ncbi:MAG TPA: carbamate kinase, partial [archaeon]|nr:carbamate kinase [archaeon]
MPVPAVVVALGGNALIRPGQRGSYPEQVRNLERVVPHLAKLARTRRLVLTHGNGPQVGDLLLQQEAAKRSVPALPLHAAVAMSQGLIG